MRIAYIVPSLRKLGPVVVAYELACQMKKRGHEVVVFFFDSYDTNTIDFPCETKKISLWESINMASFDVIHSHSLRPDLYVFLHKPLKNSHTRFITTLHNFVISDLTTEYNAFIANTVGRLWMLFDSRHDVCVVLSKEARSYYKKWFKEQKLRVVYNTRDIPRNIGLDKDEQNELIRFKKGSHLLGVNALLTYRKGIDLILKALPLLPNVKLFIIGDGKSKDELMRETIDLGVKDQVFFAGYRENAYRYIPYYDLYMMPSRSEGFPLALLEAVALKCSAVVSDIPIFKEIFDDNEVTFFEMENATSLANSVAFALTHDKSINAYQKYLRDYSPDSFGKAYLTIYSAK